jgi:hypothetical protein
MAATRQFCDWFPEATTHQRRAQTKRWGTQIEEAVLEEDEGPGAENVNFWWAG